MRKSSVLAASFQPRALEMKKTAHLLQVGALTRALTFVFRIQCGRGRKSYWSPSKSMTY